jgi:hypothetical protein
MLLLQLSHLAPPYLLLYLDYAGFTCYTEGIKIKRDGRKKEDSPAVLAEGDGRRLILIKTTAKKCVYSNIIPLLC